MQSDRLGGGPSDRRAFQLAARLARLLDTLHHLLGKLLQRLSKGLQRSARLGHLPDLLPHLSKLTEHLAHHLRPGAACACGRGACRTGDRAPRRTRFSGSVRAVGGSHSSAAARSVAAPF